MFMLFGSSFSEEEQNYLYNLFKSPLRSTLNPFLVVRLFKEAISPMMSKIQKEMPSAAEKIKMLEIDNIDKFANTIKKVFEVWQISLPRWKIVENGKREL